MSRAVGIAIVMTLVGGGFLTLFAAEEGEGKIVDLSSVLRLDLSSSSPTIERGKEVRIRGVVTNTSSEPRAIVPIHMFRYVNWSFEPRCAGVFGQVGQAIAEELGTSSENNAIVLKPGKSIGRNGTFKEPDQKGCPSGGTYVVQIQYCQFREGNVQGLKLLEGCVSSNSVAIELGRDHSEQRNGLVEPHNAAQPALAADRP
jgi:hypothetical protein